MTDEKRPYQQAEQMLCDLIDTVDDIAGSRLTLPRQPTVWLHSTEQVKDWLGECLRMVREGTWDAYADPQRSVGCAGCGHPSGQHDDGGCMYPKWNKNGGTTCGCAGYDDPDARGSR